MDEQRPQPAEEKRTRSQSGAVLSAEQAQRLADAAMAKGSRPRILTGDRTTGKLHIGHYVGSLRDRVRLQHSYDTFVLLADVQALTTHYDRPEVLKQSVLDVALDYMAIGLIPYTGGADDGSRVKIVIQSMVPAIAELTVYYGLLVPMSLILDNPTTKSEAQQLSGVLMTLDLDSTRFIPEVFVTVKKVLEGEFPELGDVSDLVIFESLAIIQRTEDVSLRDVIAKHITEENWPLSSIEESSFFRRTLRDIIMRLKLEGGIRQMNYGFLGYPVSQAADITFVGAHLVPVGEDQVPHIELTRDIVQRFNKQYGNTLVEPYALVGGGTVKGLDGNAKMSKSLDNAIYLSDSYDEIWRRISKAVTDPQRQRRSDPGRPEICNIFAYHQLFNAETEPAIRDAALNVPSVPETAELCRTAGIGCVDCKKNLAAKLDALLEPMRRRRADWAARPDDLRDVLLAGTRRGVEEGEKTLDAVKKAMQVDYFG